MLKKRVQIKITGIVQGVGFRPTVYNLAQNHNLTGNVSNTSQGVFIEIEGEISNIDNFVKNLKNNPPPLSKIDQFQTSEIPIKNDLSFEIIKSKNAGFKDVYISSDLATCPDCLNDIFDKNNRRYQYPFTNCTNCGPRFTIIKDRPYDRELTTMNKFPMCSECNKEYEDPTNRRFHAQPNACPSCGPKVHLIGIKDENPVERTILELKEKKIAAIKGLGGFNLACLADRETLIKLRVRKMRPNKAFALMFQNIDEIKKICEVSKKEEEILNSHIAPIVLLKKNSDQFDFVSPDNNYLGVMLPYTPLHHILMQNFSCIIMTSANKKDEPIAISDNDIQELINNGVADFALSHNREIAHRSDDSIVQVINEKVQVIRRSRGYVPTPIKVQRNYENNVLALGANLKNTFSFRKSNEIYISQHIGELEDIRNYNYQKREIKDLKKLLEIQESQTICDAHPNYENFNEHHSKVFHHHAHLLSVIGEHNLFNKEVLGIIADGTGYGTDGNVWGFEFLKINNDHTEFERVAHLDYFHLPGSDHAIREIDRIGISLTPGTNLKHYNDKRRYSVEMLIERNINSPLTSSLGRLFDGISSILDIIQIQEYEARAAILLQKYAESFNGVVSNRYNIEIDQNIIKHKSLISQIISDTQNNISNKEIALKFHFWIVDTISKIVSMNPSKTIVFSGGCFQNKLLTGLIIDTMINKGVEFYFNEEVPTNDAGISFGQVLI